jgi:hypothetical protein
MQRTRVGRHLICDPVQVEPVAFGALSNPGLRTRHAAPPIDLSYFADIDHDRSGRTAQMPQFGASGPAFWKPTNFDNALIAVHCTKSLQCENWLYKLQLNIFNSTFLGCQ